MAGAPQMNICFACNSYSCHHIMQGLAAQQQGRDQYHDYLRQQLGMAQMQQGLAQKYDSMLGAPAQSETKKTSNKKLLLLGR